MKTKVLLCLVMFGILLSCKNDDNTNNFLAGTTWESQEEYYGIYSFSTNTEFRFVDPNEDPVDGTYTFDGSDGVLTEETGFLLLHSMFQEILCL